jgi:hypothetical protein
MGGQGVASKYTDLGAKRKGAAGITCGCDLCVSFWRYFCSRRERLA